MLWLPLMKGQKSFMFSWWSFSWWGRQRVSSSVAYEGSQYPIDDCLQPIATQITQDARQRINDTLLTLIFRMGQGACRFLFCLYRYPIPPLWRATTNAHSDYTGCKTKNHFHSVDTDFATGISAICYCLIWDSGSLMVFWQPIYCLHVLSRSSLQCSLIICQNTSFKIHFKVSANCR